MKYFIHRCVYCGLAIEDHWIQVRGSWQLGDFHKEHVIDDGRNDLKNCVPSCKSCNSETGLYFHTIECHNCGSAWTVTISERFEDK